MKRLFTCLFLFVTAVVPVIAQKTDAQKNDESLIKTLIETETQAWQKRDAVVPLNCWANVSYASQLVSLQDGQVITFTNAKLDLSKHAQLMMDGLGKANSAKFENKDYLIHINGNAAWVTFNQTNTGLEDKATRAYATRYLERMNGGWQIVHIGTVFYKPTEK